MLLALFLAEGDDLAWLLGGLTLAGLYTTPLLLLLRFLLRTSVEFTAVWSGWWLGCWCTWCWSACCKSCRLPSVESAPG